jgi:CsoR family transcriptional regulator, copper-sensing transcriptional repressor
MAEDKPQLLNRLKTIEGHVRGVQRMVEQDGYCIDILKQTQAIQSALDTFNRTLLARHLNGCVTEAIRGEDAGERERVVNELLQLFEASRVLPRTEAPRA